jgi:hypothetical protein
VSPSDGGSDGGPDGTAPDVSEAGAGEAAACEVSPEGEIGPYFADDSNAAFNRSSILSNLDGTGTQTGIALTLTVTVIDTKNGCAPYVGGP